MTFATRGFWSLSTRGGLSIGLGVALASGARGVALSATCGAFALAMAAVAITSSVLEPEVDALGWALLLEGVSGLALGAIPLLARDGAAYPPALLSAWAFLLGVFALASADQLRARAEPSLLSIAGALSVACALALAWVTAGLAAGDALDATRLVLAPWAVAFGGLLLSTAFRVRDAAAGQPCAPER